MQRLELECEELLNWWEPKSDISFIFRFNWSSLQQLREAVTIFLSARLHAVAEKARQAVMETGCPRLKSMIASNPDTPDDMLDYLAIVSPSSVLVRIAENKNTAGHTLCRLAYEESAEVRMAVADNANSPESAFERLMIDGSADVRYRVAENPHAPLTVLYRALRDENPYVACRARQTLAAILKNTISNHSRRENEAPMPLDAFRDEATQRFAAKLMAELNETLGTIPARPPLSNESPAQTAPTAPSVPSAASAPAASPTTATSAAPSTPNTAPLVFTVGE